MAFSLSESSSYGPVHNFERAHHRTTNLLVGGFVLVLGGIWVGLMRGRQRPAKERVPTAQVTREDATSPLAEESRATHAASSEATVASQLAPVAPLPQEELPRNPRAFRSRADYESWKQARARQPQPRETTQSESRGRASSRAIRARTWAGVAALGLGLAALAVHLRPSAIECPAGTDLQRNAWLARERSEWCTDASGSWEGPAKSWYAHGSARESGTYCAGERCGVWEFHDEYGDSEVGEFCTGKRCGRWELVKGSAPSRSSEDAKAFFAENLGLTFFFRELASSSGPYVDGKREGEWTYVHHGGGRRVQEFHEDVETGWEREYYANGKLVRETRRVSGKPDGKSTSFRPDGTKFAEVSLAAGELDGRTILWSEDGGVERIVQYRRGKKHGWSMFRVDSNEYSTTSGAYRRTSFASTCFYDGDEVSGIFAEWRCGPAPR